MFQSVSVVIVTERRAIFVIGVGARSRMIQSKYQ